MLILEAKVRDGLKPVVFLDERASVGKVAAATLFLMEAIYTRLENRNCGEGDEFHELIKSHFT